MIDKGSITTLIVIILVLFLVYIIMKRRTDRIRRRHDERSKFRSDKWR